MYGQMYNQYNSQSNIERINNQIAELEKMKQQMSNTLQPTNLTQNFQLAPSNRETIKYANSINDVQREMVITDTPFFSRDMSVLWIKNNKNEIKTYELKEVVLKDDKDLLIESLQMQIDELRKEMVKNAKSINDNVDEPIEVKKSTNVSSNRTSKEK